MGRGGGVPVAGLLPAKTPLCPPCTHARGRGNPDSSPRLLGGRCSPTPCIASGARADTRACHCLESTVHFDSAWWPAIRVRLAEERCPADLRRVMDSYLSNRVVRVRYGGEECRKDTNKGCVQGSIGGPFLWNLLLDPLLKEQESRGEYVKKKMLEMGSAGCALLTIQCTKMTSLQIYYTYVL
ncbi:hypothetical protein B5X24_HaOG202192 [Helicoverpa armigera]|uniref:Uncharacterized protein n=1 Tax=Helicoverpa armigera TaxID=29058 RepID=A0A2W1BFC1_HELAM|nr:hypothetical protein B5X24_HaOG202192 [Helicoverpa armigera]